MSVDSENRSKHFRATMQVGVRTILYSLTPHMKRKPPPKFRVFSARCPKCGSTDTKLDLTAVQNLKLVPLRALATALTLPGLGTPVKMRCCACKTRFLG